MTISLLLVVGSSRVCMRVLRARSVCAESGWCADGRARRGGGRAAQEVGGYEIVANRGGSGQVEVSRFGRFFAPHHSLSRPLTGQGKWRTTGCLLARTDR